MTFEQRRCPPGFWVVLPQERQHLEVVMLGWVPDPGLQPTFMGLQVNCPTSLCPRGSICCFYVAAEGGKDEMMESTVT